MKIISINTWGGQIYEPLKEFLVKHSTDTDIICMQEVSHLAEAKDLEEGSQTNMFNDFQVLLPDFVGHFCPQIEVTGLATFVRKNIPVEKVENFIVLTGQEIQRLRNDDKIDYYPRAMQLIKLPEYNIYNFHGVPGNNKVDCPERDLQTERISEIIGKDNSPNIIIGDFNLNPDTKAVAALSEKMQNLIKINNIETTRNSHYAKKDSQPFADYAFVSNDIPVKNFLVLDDVVSDHLPLVLEV